MLDIALMVLGVLMASWGGSMKGEDGTRSGGGIAMLAVGITVAVVGALIFAVAFMQGWMTSAAS